MEKVEWVYPVLFSTATLSHLEWQWTVLQTVFQLRPHFLFQKSKTHCHHAFFSFGSVVGVLVLVILFKGIQPLPEPLMGFPRGHHRHTWHSNRPVRPLKSLVLPTSWSQLLLTAFLLPAQQPRIQFLAFPKTDFYVAEIYWRRCLEKSGQRLENVD